ncbi:unnamed protein product, partial [Timema podura]|nr:unnamed protein product [Timema podura]
MLCSYSSFKRVLISTMATLSTTLMDWYDFLFFELAEAKLLNKGFTWPPFRTTPSRDSSPDLPVTSNEVSCESDILDYETAGVADPRVKNWPLIGSPVYLLVIIALYLFFVLVAGPKFMENRRPYNLKKIIAAYNIFQVVANSYAFYGTTEDGEVKARSRSGALRGVSSNMIFQSSS